MQGYLTTCLVFTSHGGIDEDLNYEQSDLCRQTLFFGTSIFGFAHVPADPSSCWCLGTYTCDLVNGDALVSSVPGGHSPA
jgi:hypothetical protein